MDKQDYKNILYLTKQIGLNKVLTDKNISENMSLNKFVKLHGSKSQQQLNSLYNQYLNFKYGGDPSGPFGTNQDDLSKALAQIQDQDAVKLLLKELEKKSDISKPDVPKPDVVKEKSKIPELSDKQKEVMGLLAVLGYGLLNNYLAGKNILPKKDVKQDVKPESVPILTQPQSFYLQACKYCEECEKYKKYLSATLLKK